MDFEACNRAYLARCEAALTEAVETYLQLGSVVSEAARYSLLNGGKRVRGVLTLAVCDLLEGDISAAESYAAAIEMVHAASLIHDDLPCMDDDDTRRGKPATHIRYGEANALLAGDLLFLQAPEVAAGAPAPPAHCLRAVQALTHASGAKGMIYGQELDLEYETRPADGETLRLIHQKKTGALIGAAVELGVIAAGAATNPAVMEYAQSLGLCFQIVDDILDVTSSQNVLGKPVGSDEKSGKTTFVRMYGVEQAKAQVQQLTQSAVDGLKNAYPERSAFLAEYAISLSRRIY